MRFILLAISLFFASNAYAAIINELYIYEDDSNEYGMLKEELKIAKDQVAEQYLRLFKTKRKSLYSDYDKDEFVYKVGDISKKDVGAKIGMTMDQVLNQTYWGKPENVYKATNGNENIELWIYGIYGERNGITQSDGQLYFVNGKLTHRIS